MELKVGGYVLNDAGVMLSGYDGKREAYDLAPLVGVRFEERARAIGDIFEVAMILDATLLPLVNIQETYGTSAFFNGQINYKWPFSIAMLNYQRVYIYIHSIYIYIHYS